MNGLRVAVRTVVTVSFLGLLVGCGSQVDENKPVDQVKAEAQQMDVGRLRDTAMSYQKAIQAKMAHVDKIREQLKKIPPLELMGDEVKSLKQELVVAAESINALKDRFRIYYNQLKQMDGDLSGLAL